MNSGKEEDDDVLASPHVHENKPDWEAITKRDDALAESDLDEFERNEQEVLREVESERLRAEAENTQLNVIPEELEFSETSEAGQPTNPQNFRERNQKSPSIYSEDSDYPEGFPSTTPRPPPPAYSSIPNSSRITDNQLEANQSMASENPTYRLSSEIRDLFHFVEEFEAERTEIQAILRPFFLDYFPAIGDVDPFLKVPRPDQSEDHLGLIILDEPAAVQSDPTIVDMRLRQMSSVQTDPANAPVKKLDKAEGNHQQIENWIKNIKELRREKPLDRVLYGRPMPDLERLMQEWPVDVDSLLSSTNILSAKLDCSVEEFADLCLGIADIPVNGNRIHSLHHLFTLFIEFRNSQHFRALGSDNLLSSGKADRLEL